MADGVLSFPFRITPQGTASTVPYGSDAMVDEAIAALVLTQIGERPLNPLFGVPDTAFAGLHTGDVQVGLNSFGPPGVKVEAVDLRPVSPTNAIADVRWSYSDDQENQR